MIKLTHLLKEEESFTATSKKTGQTSVFKSKDSRDAAVKAGTHSKIDDKDDGDGKSPKAKPSMFSKDAGYNTPDDKKDEPFNLTDDFIDAIKVQYKNVSSQTPEQKKALEKSLINKLDKEQLKKLAFSDVNVVSDMASKKWYNLSYPSDDEPKKDKKDKSEPSTSDSIDNAYDAKDFKSTVKSLKGKVSDEDYNEIKDNLKALANLQYDLGDIDRDEDNEEWGMQKDTIDVEVDDLKGLIKQAISKSEPKKTQGKLSKFIYGDDDKKPDVVAKPEGKPDLSKYSTADEDWYTKDAASISTIYNDKLTIDDLQNVFKAKGYGDVTDTTLDDIVDRYNDDEDMRDRFKDNGISKGKLTKRIKDLKAQLKSGGTKSEPTKDSTKERAGNPKVNKVVSGKAKKLGITPQKLGKEEYESRMSKAAVEALTDANFHSEARKLISILEDKPEWDSNPMNDPDKPKDVFSKEYDEWRKNTVFSSELYDSAEGTDEIAHLATNQSGWEGETSVDAIAFDLKMNGSKKLAAKIQSIFEGKVSNGFKNHSLKNLM